MYRNSLGTLNIEKQFIMKTQRSSARKKVLTMHLEMTTNSHILCLDGSVRHTNNEQNK